jgi:hypothetical protein
MRRLEDGRIESILKIKLKDKTHIVNTYSVPQCYKHWGGWGNKSGNGYINCRFYPFCREDSLQKMIDDFERRREMEETLEKNRNRDWEDNDRFLTL